MDATIILGGGLLDAWQLSGSTKSRLDAALNLYQGEKLLVVGAGPTMSPPPLDSRGFPVFESVGAVKYLLQRGVREDQVLYETSSYDTIGNAYFSKVIHVDPAGYKQLRVITSDFHMPRTKLVFEWVYGLTADVSYEISFVPTLDTHFSSKQLDAHKKKEQQRIDELLLLQGQIKDTKQLHDWMFAEHAAYCAHLQPIEMIVDNDKDVLLPSSTAG